MCKNKSIALTGFMGCGKSTVGRAVAEKIGFRFIDCDEEIVRKAGMSIPLIFEKCGEEGFRAVEKTVIAALAATERAVIATGGGAVKTAENIENLKTHSVIIYLKANPDQLCKNLQDDYTRPLLIGEIERLQIITTMLNDREPLYLTYADCIVRVNNKTVAKTAEAVIEAYQRQGGCI